MSKILIVGDLHIGKGGQLGTKKAHSLLHSRVKDQLDLLEWIYYQVCENEVDCICLTGDIFEDTTPEFVLVQYFLTWLQKINSLGVPTFIIPGNHDIERIGVRSYSPLDILTTLNLENIHYTKNLDTVYVGNVGITLVPFRDRKSFNLKTTQEALNELQDLIEFQKNSIPLHYHHILIGHQALEGSLYIGDEIDDEANELICPLSMFSGYDYVWMGHVHKPQVLARKPHIAHIGSLDAGSFSKEDQDKILILFDTENKDLFEEIKVPNRNLHYLKITVEHGEDSTEKVLIQLNELAEKEKLKGSIFRINVNLMSSDIVGIDKQRIERQLYEHKVHFISEIVEKRTVQVSQSPSELSNIKINTLDPKKAISLYSEKLNFESKKEKEVFISDCLDVITTVNNKS